MSASRRLMGVVVALGLLGLTGCGDAGSGNEVPPSGPAKNVSADVGIVPDASGSRIRGKGGETPSPPAAPDEIVIPKDGGLWPWNLAPAPPAAPFQPVTLADVGGRITGLAVRPEANRAAITVQIPRKNGAPERTRILWFDTAAGRMLADWEMSGPWVPLDVSRDGTRILARGDGPHAPAYRMSIWTVSEKLALKPRTWEPHTSSGAGLGGALVVGTASPDDRSRDIIGGAWVGDRVISASAGGQFRVIDAETLKHVGTIDATPGRPAVSPDGTRAAFLAKDGVALIDPATCRVTGWKKTGTTPAPATLAFSPDGKGLVIGGHDRVVLLDLDSGNVRNADGPGAAGSRGPISDSFGWAGTRHLFWDHYLYGLDSPQPAWDYRNVAAARCLGWQTWVVVQSSGSASATLRPFDLPHPIATSRATSRSSDLLPEGIRDRK